MSNLHQSGQDACISKVELRDLEVTNLPDVLVIDDMRIFDDFPDAVYARTRIEGSVQLFSRAWDIVFLDHDLGEQAKEGSHDFGDIRPLIKKIVQTTAELGPINVAQFYVCSSNPPGRDWIISMLADYYSVEYFCPKHHVL